MASWTMWLAGEQNFMTWSGLLQQVWWKRLGVEHQCAPDVLGLLKNKPPDVGKVSERCRKGVKIQNPRNPDR